MSAEPGRTMPPLPRVTERLKALLGAGVEVGTVLDVGVQTGTHFLLECLPAVPHLLFEPVEQYFAEIRKNYAHTKHELFEVAASCDQGTVWLLEFCLDGTNKVTHSQLVDAPVEVGSKPDLLHCRPVRRASLDVALAGRDDKLPYLLKVDVDGHEIPILEGANAILAKSSICIVEASIPTVGAKINLLNAAGFQLFDIVDLCYYHGVMSQADLIFVHRDWIARCPDLRPWQTKTFSWEAWNNLSRHPLLDPAAGKVCVHAVVLPTAVAHLVRGLQCCLFALTFSRSAQQPPGRRVATSSAAPCWR